MRVWSLAVADPTVCMVLVVCWWGGLEECRRLWDFELGKWLNTVKGTWPLSRSLEKKQCRVQCGLWRPSSGSFRGNNISSWPRYHSCDI